MFVCFVCLFVMQSVSSSSEDALQDKPEEVRKKNSLTYAVTERDSPV